MRGRLRAASRILRNPFGPSQRALSVSGQRLNGRRKDQLMFSRRFSRPIALAAIAVAVGGGAYGIVSATASGSSAADGTGTTTTGAPQSGPAGGGARSGPAA